MTERRYLRVLTTGDIKDTVTGELIRGSRIGDLLNDLYEERNYFERKKCEYFNRWNNAHLDNINLRKKNEDLKKELKDCHKSNHEYYIDKDKLIRLCEEFHINWRMELEE